MDSATFLREQFITLRKEIHAINSRLFWIVTIGLFGIPLLAYFALSVNQPVMPLVPYSALVLIVLFLAEQTKMMRAGRFVRQHIEKQLESTPGWEGWLESSAELRLMEKHFSACFLVVFFMFYFATIGLAVEALLHQALEELSGQYWIWLYGMSATYLIGAIWVISILVHHWRFSVGTSFEPKK
jgi:hypothetical protein